MNEERLPFAKGVGQHPVNRRWLAVGATLAIVGVALFAWLAHGDDDIVQHGPGPGTTGRRDRDG
ncbi:MAG: hypothetical protein U5Q44_09660 [Dehalococcoidia bacterium]|nr:hypothetical protein [Dehalococcoidia bacterium]